MFISQFSSGSRAVRRSGACRVCRGGSLGCGCSSWSWVGPVIFPVVPGAISRGVIGASRPTLFARQRRAVLRTKSVGATDYYELRRSDARAETRVDRCSAAQ